MTRSNRQLSWSAAVCLMAMAAANPVAAQSSASARVEISANVGVLTGASTFTASTSLPSNGGERATVAVDHDVKTTLGFSVGGAVRVIPRIWVGAQYAMAEMKPSASIAAVIPHPILFDASRTVEGPVSDVAHNEQNVHVAVMYVLPVQAVDVKVMGGPTFFKVEQDFVSAVTIDETYPFDSATFSSAATKQLSESAVGFNVGVDISRLLSSNVGVGALIRYSRGDVKFNDPTIGQQTVTAGGVEVAGGLRLRF